VVELVLPAAQKIPSINLQGMAFQELVNFGIHAKQTPWATVNFYDILGVSRAATNKFNQHEFEDCIREACAKRFIDIPTVAANMDVYIKDDPHCWDEEVKVRFDELIRAHKTLRAKVDTSASTADLHAVLGVAVGAGPDVLDRALKVQLLCIPNTRCHDAFLYEGGEMRDEELWYYPVDDVVEFEKLESAYFVLAAENPRPYLRELYDHELEFDPRPLAQLRATHRAMYRQRFEVEDPAPRLAELRRAVASAATAAEGDDLRDQLRYVLWEKARDENVEWCRNETSQLRKGLAEASSLAERAAKLDELEILEADATCRDLYLSLRKKTKVWLESRQAVLSDSLDSREADAMDMYIEDAGFVALAIRRQEMRADLCRFEAEVAGRGEWQSRVEKVRQTLSTLETNAEGYRLRAELRIVKDTLLDMEVIEKGGYFWGRGRICKGYCGLHKPLHAYRREKNGDIQERCMICEFPACEVCKRKPKKPVHGDKETGAWYAI
jgi:hypothetical protein